MITIYKTINKEYYIVSFSIKKHSGNIYGIIFGSSNLLGLFKFLEICWKQDIIAGEANYPIEDDDFLYAGQLSLNSEENVPRKLDRFKSALIQFLKQRRNNIDLFPFCLEHGFLPKHINAIIKQLRLDNVLIIENPEHKSIRFTYISWNEYKTTIPKAFFVYRGE